MSKGNLTLLFNNFEKEHFGKDVFLVPYCLGRTLGYDVTIVYPLSDTNKDFPDVFKGVKLMPIKLKGHVDSHYLYREFNFFLYVLKNARRINTMIRFHNSFQTKLLGIIYKIMNPKGKLYVKLDINEKKVALVKNLGNIRGVIYKCITKLFLRSLDFVSCETKSVYEMIKGCDNYEYDFGDKLLLLENGFDEDSLSMMKIEEKDFSQKENCFITVGRLGTFEKNTELILEALIDLDLKDWKFYFVGPTSLDFDEKIKDFFKTYPHLKNRVVFWGPIYDKEKLWSMYNMSKVFVLSSRSEGYPIVFGEAKRFRNFILTTPVGGSVEITENGKYGIIYSHQDSHELTTIMQAIVNGDININVYQDFNPRMVAWDNVLQPLLDKLNENGVC